MFYNCVGFLFCVVFNIVRVTLLLHLKEETFGGGVSVRERRERASDLIASLNFFILKSLSIHM